MITPRPHCDSSRYLTPGQFGGCLGVEYDPFVLNADPNAEDFKVREFALPEGIDQGRFDDRLALLAGLDPKHSPSRPAPSRVAGDFDTFHDKAASIVRTGKAAEASLERAGITCNKNAVPFDPEKPFVTSGVRLGTPAATTRGFGPAEWQSVGNWIGEVLSALADNPDDNSAAEGAVRERVAELCARFPIYADMT